MAKQKYYVVWKGRRTGIFKTWEACSAQVTGFTGAQYKSFESLPAAESAFKGAYSAVVATKPSPTAPLIQALPSKTARMAPQTPSICVDAACSGVPGPLEWRGVHTGGAQIFKSAIYPDGTNNIGEFLAIVQGLRWLQTSQLDWPLYSDSTNALLWVRLKKCRTKQRQTSRNGPLFKLIAEAEGWLAENRYTNKVLKWETDDWGENPADFGRK